MVSVDDSGNDAGNITNPGSNSTTSTFQGRTYFEHQPAKNFGGADELEYTARWVAPQSGEATFYVSSMLVNGNGNNSGDTYVSMQKTFTVMEQGGTLQASITDQSDVLCNGESNGTATVTASGGSENYSYNWDNGETNAMASMLDGGTHSVTVSDGSSNMTVMVTIGEPSALNSEVEILGSVECADSNTGSLQANVNAGTPPYSYTWSNNQNTQQIDNLSPGLYTVIVNDNNGCATTADISLFAMDVTAPSLEVAENVDVFLNNETTVVDVTEVNGIVLSIEDNCTSDPSLVYSQMRFDCDDIGANALTVTASDDTGNQTSKTLTVNVIDEVAPRLLCINETLNVGTCAPLTYASPSVMDNCDNFRLELISGIGPNGQFPVGETKDVYMVTDGSGNTATCEITINNDPEINLDINVTNISCAGENDGSVEVSVTGTNNPFSVTFGEGASDNLSAGSYSFVTTDFTGCSVTSSFEIVEPSAINLASSEVTMPTNSSSGDGAIDITLDGGTPPYSFEWMTDDEFFSDQEDLSLLFPGEYFVVVTDSRGCTITSESFVLEAITGINDPGISSRINTYPNPANEYLNISIEDLSFSNAKMKIFSYTGKMVLKEDILVKDSRFELNTLENGLYILKLQMDDEIVTLTFVKNSN